jgi:hypothetical protein
MAEKAKHVHVSHIGSMIPQTVIVKGGSYSSCIVIPLEVRIVGRHVPKPWCLSPAADSLDFRIAGRQDCWSSGAPALVPQPSC